jgi:hypothetical protein
MHELRVLMPSNIPIMDPDRVNRDDCHYSRCIPCKALVDPETKPGIVPGIRLIFLYGPHGHHSHIGQLPDVKMKLDDTKKITVIFFRIITVFMWSNLQRMSWTFQRIIDVRCSSR